MKTNIKAIVTAWSLFLAVGLGAEICWGAPDPCDPALEGTAETDTPNYLRDKYGIPTIASGVEALGLAPYVWKCSGADETFRAEATMPGAYLKATFRGTTTIGLILDGTANDGCPASSMPVIEYCIDEGPFTIVQLSTTGAVYTLPLASDLDSGIQHRLDLYFRAADLAQQRWYSSVSRLRIAGIALGPDGVFLPRPKQSKLAIGFGDSITEGVGVDGLFTSWQLLDVNNARGSWFPIVCSALDCEYGQLGSGGQGMVNTSMALPPLPQTWDRYDSLGLLRLEEGLLVPEPDYVFCCMGTNDNQDITGAYVDWLIVMRQASPNAQFFCVTPPLGDRWHASEVRAVVAARNAAGDAKVYLIDTSPLEPGFKAGQGGTLFAYDGVHPSMYGHAILGSFIAAEAQRAISAVCPEGP